jgi:hypothetical protein
VYADLDILPRTKIALKEPFLSIQERLLCLCVRNLNEIGELGGGEETCGAMRAEIPPPTVSARTLISTARRDYEEGNMYLALEAI